MANEEQLTLLKLGTDIWNAWRKKNRGVVVDLKAAHLPNVCLIYSDLRSVDFQGSELRNALLSHSDLSFANLSEVGLIHADLVDANLRNSDLRNASLRKAMLNFVGASRAHFSGADLRDANLSGIDMSFAELSNAQLTNARLDDANLSGAILIDADLRRVSVKGADFAGASLGGTDFAATDLSKTKNLQNCRHLGPSIIDNRTLQQSGQLPLDFLRGCGFADWEIEVAKLYQESLSHDKVMDIAYELARLRGERPIQFYSCFISYSSEDSALARQLHADLQSEGIRCWFAPEDMKIGDRIRTRIDEVIRLHEKLLLVLSEHSIQSDWVEKEVETAFEKEREGGGTVLFPVRLDDAILESRTGWAADIRRSRHIGDFTGWKDRESYQQAFARLLRDLRVDPPPASHTPGE